MLSHCLVLCLYIKVCTSLSVLSVALVGPGALKPTAGDGIESRRPVLVVVFVDNYIYILYFYFAPLLVCAIIIIIIIIISLTLTTVIFCWSWYIDTGEFLTEFQLLHHIHLNFNSLGHIIITTCVIH